MIKHNAAAFAAAAAAARAAARAAAAVVATAADAYCQNEAGPDGFCRHHGPKAERGR